MFCKRAFNADFSGFKSRNICLFHDRIIEINMNGFSKGNYDLTIFDSKNKNMYVSKIILQ